LLLFTAGNSQDQQLFSVLFAVGVVEKRGFPRRWPGSWLFFTAYNSDISGRGSILNIGAKVEPRGFGVQTSSGCITLSRSVAAGRGGEVARERRLEAREVEEIFTAFAEAMRELPPDVEAGWLDAQGDLRLAPDIARKLRTARRVRQLLQELRYREREG
jgi:hypothetical protein